MEQFSQNLFDLQIDHQSNSYLSEAAKWGKFLSIMGFIFCGLFVLSGIFQFTVAGSLMSGLGGTDRAGAVLGGGLLVFIYIVFALISFFPCLYLFNFFFEVAGCPSK